MISETFLRHNNVIEKMNEQSLLKKLKKEGFTNLRICPLPPPIDTGEHTHDQHTVHLILEGTLTITDKKGTKIFRPGDRVEFPAGTTHTAKGSVSGKMISGVKE